MQPLGYSHSVVFNFCQRIRKDKCGKTLAGLVSNVEEDQGKCIAMASDSPRVDVETEYKTDRSYIGEEKKTLQEDDEACGRLDLIYDGG